MSGGALACALVTVLVAACGGRDRTLPRPVDGGATTADSGSSDAGAADPRCPAVPAFTGMACTVEQLGSTCTGSSMCTCSPGDFRTVPTSCTCNASPALGRVYECVDACPGACGGSDAGVQDAGFVPTVSCTDYCARLATVTCSMPVTGCDGACEMLRARGCPAEFNTYLACAVEAPVVCSKSGYPMTSGCSSEDAAWSACVGG